MFIHSIPGGLPVEVYAFRPYGKATIWEQRDLLELAADLEVEVFLWERRGAEPVLIRHHNESITQVLQAKQGGNDIRLKFEFFQAVQLLVYGRL